jgi:FkbM family methyltransferase
VAANHLPAGIVRGVPLTTPIDEEIIRSFPKYEGPGTPGFVTDFLGIRTRTSYISSLTADGAVEGYPIPGNFHATGLEWAGTLRAVLDAGPSVVAAELGAGWGPWLVTVARAAQSRGISDVRLIGVEGSRSHVEYMRTHFADNGLDPDRHTLLHGIAAAADGEAEFPVLDEPASQWGTAAIQAGEARPASGVRTEVLRAYSLASLLDSCAAADLVHIDIQGHEADVVAASEAVLNQKVKRLVIGTHGRHLEQQLLDTLGRRGWTLESEEPCIFQQTESGLHLFIDGCQVWRNRRLLPDRS